MKTKHTALLLDDEPHILDALERLLRKQLRIIKFTSGKQALEELKQNSNIQIIISDHRMPEMTGVEFLKESLKYNDTAIRILLTGYTDIESLVEAINQGQIYKYITKPWDGIDLLNTVQKALEKFDLREELKLKNKQLQTALEELKVLDQSKSQFMLLINHELKTPLTVMYSYLQLLQESTLDESSSLYLKQILKGYSKIERIINDSLLLVEASLAKRPHNQQNIEIEKILADVLLEPHIAEKLKTQNIHLDIEANAKIKSDYQGLKEILLRTIDNALQFSQSDQPVRIQFKNDTFTITNTGQPFPSEKIQTLLKPFTIEEDIMNHSKGTGMGLSIANALAANHGLKLHLDAQGPTTCLSLSPL